MKKPMSPPKVQDFYSRVLKTLIDENLPFMVGGAYALQEYTGVHRQTKDFDVFCVEEDYPTILKALSDAGYDTELTNSQWIVKVIEKNQYVDFIFADPGGLFQVNKSWLKHARIGQILDVEVKLMPVEEMIMSKMYRQKRDHFDGPDIMHLLLKQGEHLDWKRIFSGMSSHWHLVLEHVITFWFVYPSERDVIPKWVMEELVTRVKKEMTAKIPDEKLCRGLLLSPNGKEYEVDITEWGFKPIKTKK